MVGHTLTGLDSGAMLMAGGYRQSFFRDWSKDIWLFKEDVWSLIGSLIEVRRDYFCKFIF